jgi:hypothetical protein
MRPNALACASTSPAIEASSARSTDAGSTTMSSARSSCAAAASLASSRPLMVTP